MRKINYLLILAVAIIALGSYNLAYAFMTLTTDNPTSNMELQENNNENQEEQNQEDTSQENNQFELNNNLINNLQLTSDNNTSTDDNAVNHDKTPVLKDTFHKSPVTNTQAQTVPIKKQIPVITNIKTTDTEDNTLIIQKEFKPSFKIEDILSQLNKLPAQDKAQKNNKKSTDQKNSAEQINYKDKQAVINSARKTIATEFKDSKYLEQFQNSIEEDLNKSFEFNEVASKELESEISDAVELAKCREYYSNNLKADIAKIYNRLSLAQDKLKKTMIAYTLWKQTISIDPLADSLVNHDYNTGLGYVSMGFYQLSDFVKEHDIEFKKEKSCDEIAATRFLEMDLNDRAHRLIYAKRDSLNALARVKYMKHPIIEEFSDVTPFDRIFIFFLHCLYDEDYDEYLNENFPYDRNGEKIYWPVNEVGEPMECRSKYNSFLDYYGQRY